MHVHTQVAGNNSHLDSTSKKAPVVLLPFLHTIPELVAWQGYLVSYYRRIHAQTFWPTLPDCSYSEAATAAAESVKWTNACKHSWRRT